MLYTPTRTLFPYPPLFGSLGTAGTGADRVALFAELTGRAAAAPGRRRILIEVRGALRAEVTDAVAPSGG
ncbi:hypothetical protein ABT286_19645 [Streptomyces rochei]|uniref:hypothetical protein n=1 Tax=Streptomyces rochei TaxID=1928 RepID=UPI003325AA2A